MAATPTDYRAALLLRLSARLLDTLVLIVLMVTSLAVIVGMAFGFGVLWDAASENSPGNGMFPSVGEMLPGAALLMLGLPICTLASYAYDVIVPRRHAGQTLGKRLVGVRIALADTVTPSWRERQSLATRWLHLNSALSIAPVIVGIRWLVGVDVRLEDVDVVVSIVAAIWALLVGLSIVLSRSRRGLHDRRAGTIVVAAVSGRSTYQRSLESNPQ